MAWFGPQPCNCQCCRCTPKIQTGCAYVCDNKTTGIENIYISLRNYPAGEFISYIIDSQDFQFGILRLIKKTVYGYSVINREKQLILSQVPTEPGYNQCGECQWGLMFGQFPNSVVCCYKTHPFTYTLNGKWEIKFFAPSVGGTIDPCVKWGTPHIDYFFTDRSSTFTAFGIVGCTTPNPPSPCPDFGSSLNAMTAKQRCDLTGGLDTLPVPDFPLHGDFLCGKLEQFVAFRGCSKPCPSDTPDCYETYAQYYVDKKQGDNQFLLPVAYEIVISDLPNKYYFYDDESGPEAVEITGLDQFNGTYNIETENNGCVNTPYIEEIAVDVAAFQISRWQFPSGNCTNTPFPNPFPATGTAVLRMPPVPRKPIFGSSALVYDWIVISIQNPFTGVGLLQHNISTFQGLSCKETDNQLVPGNTCLPLPNPYFRIRIKPIY